MRATSPKIAACLSRQCDSRCKEGWHGVNEKSCLVSLKTHGRWLQEDLAALRKGVTGVYAQVRVEELQGAPRCANINIPHKCHLDSACEPCIHKHDADQLFLPFESFQCLQVSLESQLSCNAFTTNSLNLHLEAHKQILICMSSSNNSIIRL